MVREVERAFLEESEAAAPPPFSENLFLREAELVKDILLLDELA